MNLASKMVMGPGEAGSFFICGDYIITFFEIRVQYMVVYLFVTINILYTKWQINELCNLQRLKLRKKIPFYYTQPYCSLIC
jgi:hypothetical protein